MKEEIKEISEQMIERYSRRYREMGYNVKTLGWGSTEQQQYRFQQTLSVPVEFAGKSVLDIGCGFGDYGDFLIRENIEFEKYTGWDINVDLIREAQTRKSAEAKFEFQVENIALLEEKQDAKFDVGVMLGVLNLNLKGKVDNYEYSKKNISTAFSLVKDVLIVDFLSTNLSLDYPKEDFVFYHDPLKMIEFAFTLSSNVVLKHDYAAIPQKEFMLFIYK
jgi:SAM-dependent methyltransferase